MSKIFKLIIQDEDDKLVEVEIPRHLAAMIADNLGCKDALPKIAPDPREAGA